MNSNNFAQKKAQFILPEKKNCEYQGLFTYLLLQVIFALNHARMQKTHKTCYKTW
jgi:hypothetical protein